MAYMPFLIYGRYAINCILKNQKRGDEMLGYEAVRNL
jgi:hypothetical protein